MASRNSPSVSVREAIFERDRYRCRYCGRYCGHHRSVLTIDHIVPASAFPAGSHFANRPSNLTTCCRQCNSKKGSAMRHGCCFVSALVLYHPELKMPTVPTQIAQVKAAIHERKASRQRPYKPEERPELLRVPLGECVSVIP